MIRSQTTARIHIKGINRITAAYTLDVEDAVWGIMRDISQTPRDQTILRAIFRLDGWIR